MCFCFTSNENCHFSSEKRLLPQNGVLIFLGKETHSETKSWKSSRILTKKVTTTTVNPGNRRGFCVSIQISSFFFLFSSFFFIFSFFSSFFHFFICFQFFLFLIFFMFFIFFIFSFFHFSSFSLVFYHFHSFSFIFIFFVGCSESDFFLSLNFVTISLDNSYVKNQFLGPSREVPLWALFSFFSTLFFSRFLVFFLAFYFSFFLFFVHFFNFLIF